MTPTVSVVIPCFNLGAYLDEAVQSVLDQTYQDFEIVIVDDGSDDALTRHVLASYRRPRTRIIRTENGGVAQARNRGLAEAHGQLLSFLDADDILEPSFLEKTVAVLGHEPSLAFASCWLRAFGADEFEWTPESCDFPHLLAEDTVCTAALTRRDVLEAVGGFDPDPRFDGYEDWDLAISLVESGHAGEIVPEFLFRYRIRPGSKSATRTAPENHARVVEYVVDKHTDSFRQHREALASRIRERIEVFERGLADPPARPTVRVDENHWREAILALENHRRMLEELAQGPPRTDGPDPVEWGSLRGVEPVSRVWGLDRGRPVDRYYIERFLEAHRADIRGEVLEVKDPGYTRQFGDGVGNVEVVDVVAQNPEATLVADLADPGSLPENRFDCFILTQTIHVIYDTRTVAENAFRTLQPGGVVLATLPCVSRVDYESGLDSDFWRFTQASARRLFGAAFGPGNVEVEVYGNVLAGTAFLQGLAADELTPDELEHVDPYFPLIVGVRAQKPDGPQAATTASVRVEGNLERATCQGITGWAWDRAHPARRVTVHIWEGDRQVASAQAKNYRADLAAADFREGDVAFSAAPLADLHGDRTLFVRASVAGQELRGSPLPVQCICGRAKPTLEEEPPAEARPDAVRVSRPADDGRLRAYLDAPVPDSKLEFPWLDVTGWAIPATGHLTAVELAVGPDVFRTLRPQARPDLTDAFADVAWAGASGFTTRLSLLGLQDDVEIKLCAVSCEGSRAEIGRIKIPAGSLAEVEELPVVIAIEPGDSAVRAAGALGQRCRVRRIVSKRAAGGSGESGHPGIEVGDPRAIGSEPGADLVWLTDGEDSVAEDFLPAATRALAEHPDAVFAVGVEAGQAQLPINLVSVLSGTGVGNSVLFKADALRSLDGFDETAPSAVVAQWDLCVRLVAAGNSGTSVETACLDNAARLSDRAGEEATRWLYRKHAQLYERHLKEVLLDREMVIARFLRQNHIVEAALESDLRPLARARRRERDRLGAKVRRLRAGDGGAAATSLDWGDFRRLEPVSALWGCDRGLSVASYYIERFLEQHAEDVHGKVLQAHDSVYAHRYGGSRVGRCDVVDIDATNPAATIVADLRDARGIESSEYDCVILTQVLQLIHETNAVLRECSRMLKPGGVLLATVPCVSRIDPDSGLDGDHWRFTESALRRLLDAAFAGADVEVRAEGNRSVALAFLAGLAADEVDDAVLDRRDPSAPLLLTVRAVRRARDGDR